MHRAPALRRKDSPSSRPLQFACVQPKAAAGSSGIRPSFTTVVVIVDRAGRKSIDDYDRGKQKTVPKAPRFLMNFLQNFLGPVEVRPVAC